MFMTRTRRFSPRATFGDSFDALDQEFSRLFRRASRHQSGAFPTFNIWENQDGVVITSELPGVKMEDLEVTVSGSVLTIKGSRKDEGCTDDSRCLRRERRSGEFVRTVELPFQVDAGKVEAKLTNGVLHINLPKAESEKPKKIAVNVN